METYNPTATTNPDQHLFELQIDQQSIAYLGETARWAKFLSIVGFIFCGLTVILAFFIGSIFARIGGESAYLMAGMGGVFTAVYIVLAIIMFFPALFMFRFATKMQIALRNNDQVNLNESLAQLKSYFKFLGILTIVVLGLYALAFIVGILGSLMR